MNDQEYLNCRCFSCSGHIEFPAEGIGETVRCPHCNLDTTLYKMLMHKLPETKTEGKEPEPQIQIPLEASDIVRSESEAVTDTVTTSGSQQTNQSKACFGGALILLVIGLFFLTESAEEQYEQKMLSSAYKQHLISGEIYQIDMQLYRLGGATRSSVNRSEANFKDADERIDKQKQKLSEIAASRRFKMCLFFAGAAVFFISGLIQSSKPRN